MRSDPAVSREDFEAYQIDVERKREQVEGFKTVERIISSREVEANEDVEYQHRKYFRACCPSLKMLIPPSPAPAVWLQWNTCASGKA